MPASRSSRTRGRALLAAATVAFCALGLAAEARATPGAYVANAGGASVSQFSLGAGGLLTPLSPATVGAGFIPAGVAVSPDGRSLYATNLEDDTVSQYDVGASGKLSPKSPATVAAGDGPLGVAVSPNGKSVYVANSISDHITHDNVSQYTVGAGGKLAIKSPSTVSSPGDNPQGVAVSPDGQSVYVAQQCCAANGLAQYNVGSNGRLSPKSPAGVAGGGSAVAVSPGGGSVYVTSYFGTSVAQHTIGAGGKLSPKSPATVAAVAGTDALAVSPNGKSVYVAGYSANAVSQYNVGAGGKLSPKSPATVAAGSHPLGIATSPDGESVYVANGNDGTISQYDVDGGGRLSAKSPATVATGNSLPFGVATSPGASASVSVASHVLTIAAAAGARDNLAITRPLPGTLRVTNAASGPYAGSPLHAGTGCAPSADGSVRCNPSGVNRISVSGGDRGDRVTNSTGIQSSIYGGPANDVLIGGRANDMLTGGPGADLIRGMNGDDRLLERDLTSDTTINCDGGNAPGSADRADLDLLPKDPNAVVQGCETKTRH